MIISPFVEIMIDADIKFIYTYETAETLKRINYFHGTILTSQNYKIYFVNMHKKILRFEEGFGVKSICF